MIYNTLVADIKKEAQLENDTSWDAVILSLLNEELINIANLQNTEQLHTTKKILTSVDQGGDLLVALPADFLKVDKIKYITSLNTWVLPKNNGIVPPIPEASKPKSYEIDGVYTSGVVKLRLIPSVAMTVATDNIDLSYFIKPSARIAGDTVAPESWIPSLKKGVIERLLVYSISDASKQAEMFSKLSNEAKMGQMDISKNIQQPEKAYDSPRSA